MAAPSYILLEPAPPPAYMPTITYYFRSRDPSSPSTPYVLNSVAVDSYGTRRAACRVETDRKGKVTKVSRADGTRLAKFDWDQKIPGIKINGKEMKCKEWSALQKDQSTRTLMHAGKTYVILNRGGIYILAPEDVPGRTIAVWQTKDRYLQLEAFPDANAIRGLLDTCFVALVMIESRRDLGDLIADEEGVNEGGTIKKTVLGAVGESIGGALANAFH